MLLHVSSPDIYILLSNTLTCISGKQINLDFIIEMNLRGDEHY